MDEADWAINEFGAALLGDSRRTDRLIALATVLGQRPAASIPAAYDDPAMRKGAYRFFENAAIAPAAILASHVDATWERIKPFVAADFADRDGAMLAAQWQACLDYASGELLPRIPVPIHAVAFSEDVQTPPRRVREVAELAAHGHFHLLQGLGHGSAFGHRPEVVNACLRSIIDQEWKRSTAAS